MRSSPLIEYSSTVLLICLWLGAITTVFSSLVGLFQQDIKKVIAYSTMSQKAQENNIFFRHQTICVGVILKIINSQITKAHDYLYYNNHISNRFFNSFSAMWQYLSILNYQTMSEKWKIVTICKQVGISEAIRLILILISSLVFPLLNSAHYFTLIPTNRQKPLWLRLKYDGCLIFKSSYSTLNTPNNQPDPFFEWLAGAIDGDGYFNLSKGGTARFTITMDIRDKKALYEIKHKLGGSIYTIANANALRYQLSHKKGLMVLLNGVNGLIRNPVRMLQMNKLCVKYGIELIYPKALTFNNGWLSGFIDSDGSVYFNEQSGQVFISATQKNKYLLEPLLSIYSGRIDILSPKIEAFKFIIYRKNELFNLVDNYFTKYPLKTKKNSRINLLKQFYLLRTYRNSKDISKFNQWISFKEKWEKYQD